MKKNKIKPILDIAILTAGRVDLFEKCVEALLPQLNEKYRVHIHNNGHPSKEYEQVYRKLPNASIIRSNVMTGFSDGANKAIRSGNAPLVLFVTDDIFIHEGAIESLLARMEDTTIGQCGYKFMFPEDSSDPARPAGKVQHVGMATTVRGDMVHPLLGWNPDHPKCNISREVVAVTGASFMIRREAFNAVGGFDPIYGRGYYEDIDLSFKLRAFGKRIFIETDATATHGVGQTFKDLQEPLPIAQNQMIFKLRWGHALSYSEWEMW